MGFEHKSLITFNSTKNGAESRAVLIFALNMLKELFY